MPAEMANWLQASPPLQQMGPEEMRVIRHHVDIGVDNVKLSMSGEGASLRNSFLRIYPVLI